MSMRNIFKTTSLFLLALMVIVTAVTALPVEVLRVELNDIELSAQTSTRLSVERNQEIKLELTLKSSEDLKEVEAQAFLTGYEYNSFERIAAAVKTLDLKKDTLYVRSMTLKLPQELEKDNYKLRLIISDRDSEAKIVDYPLKIDVPRHELKIQDVTLFPRTVKAGEGLLARVRLANKGDKDEKNVKVSVSIPALGTKDSRTVSEVNADDEEETEEMLFDLDKCTQAGKYDVVVEVLYDKEHRKLVETREVMVEANSACQKATSTDTTVKTPTTQTPSETSESKSSLRSALQIVLVVLVALLVVVALIIGFSKLKEDDE